MTVSEHVFAEGSGAQHPLRRGATPATIRARLLPEDRDAFVAAYQQALDDARHSLDLTVVHDVVEHWRRRAVLQTDPEGYRETVRRVAELATGAPPPTAEPFEVTRTKAGLQRLVYEVDYWSDDVASAVAAMPEDLLVEFAELRAALELSPWTVGAPWSLTAPDIPSRTVTLGAAGHVLITFGIRESDARVVTIVQIALL